MKEETLRERLFRLCEGIPGGGLEKATEEVAYGAACLAVKELLLQKNRAFSLAMEGKGQNPVYILSTEFSAGASLKNYLFSLGLEEKMRKIFAEAGKDLNRLYERESDTGPGDGRSWYGRPWDGRSRDVGLWDVGLWDSGPWEGDPGGAAAVLEAASDLGLFCTGFGLKGAIPSEPGTVSGGEKEIPCKRRGGEGIWQLERRADAVEIRFGGAAVGRRARDGSYRVELVGYRAVTAFPRDLLIPGYRSEAVNRLTLWEVGRVAHSDRTALESGDGRGFSETGVEKIDGKREGWLLHQQYLLVSASLQSILKEIKSRTGSLDGLPQRLAIHGNGACLALGIPELMRLLLDEYGYEWDCAWQMTSESLSGTARRVGEEASECWEEGAFASLLPRVYQIVREIDRRELLALGKTGKRGREGAILSDGKISVLNLCRLSAHTGSVVSTCRAARPSEGHFCDSRGSGIPRLPDVTGVISCRRWLCRANPALRASIADAIGENFLLDGTRLRDLLPFREDAAFLESLNRVKRENKCRLSKRIAENGGFFLDPDSLFDVQAGDFCQYRRQLLNLLHILSLYLELKNSPDRPQRPKTFLFFGRARPGRIMAKRLLALTVKVGEMLGDDRRAREFIRVAVLTDPRVCLAEELFSAVELSERLFLAGSGKGSAEGLMLMLNGAVTVGTLDGVNEEIFTRVGEENFFRFGLRAKEVEELREHYDPAAILSKEPLLREVLALLSEGVAGERFDDIVYSLRRGLYSRPDPALSLADFADYRRARQAAFAAYEDRVGFAKRALVNIACAGDFSSERVVREYAEKLWWV